MNRARRLLMVVAGVLLLASPLFAADTEVGGEVHAYWTFHLNDQGTVIGNPGQVKNYSAFSVSRALLGMTHEFSDKFSARVAVDIYNTDDMHQLDIRALYAYLHIRGLLPHTDGRFGLQGLVWADKVDQIWGLRYVDLASMEKLGYINYADFGASLYGVCPSEKKWGEIVLQVVNGGGYTETEQNKYKDFVIFANVMPLESYPEFKDCALWFQYYKGWPNIDPIRGLSFSDNTKKDRLSVAGVLKYKEWFTAYADFFMTDDDTNPSETPIVTVTGIQLPEEDKARGITLIGKLSVATDPETFLSDIFLFGKLEQVNKHDDYDDPELVLYADEGDGKYLTLGAAYTLEEGFEFALTFKRSTVDRIEYDEDGMPLRIAETEKNSLLLNMKAEF